MFEPRDPPEHDARCPAICEWRDQVFDHEEALRLLLDAAAGLSYWQPGWDQTVRMTMTQHEQAWPLVECPAGHRSHECRCADLHVAAAEHQAEAYAEWAAGHRGEAC